MDDMNELPDNLARALQDLDARAARAAAKVDSAHVAEAVLKRLGEPDVETRRPMWRLTGVRIAAALVLLAVSGVTARRIVIGRHASLPLTVQADSMTAGDMDDVLKAVDDARVAGHSAFAPAVSVDDLTEAELKALLAAMESAAVGETT
jgi:hypothetical protein